MNKMLGRERSRKMKIDTYIVQAWEETFEPTMKPCYGPLTLPQEYTGNDEKKIE
jgi:hypothetical protein